MSVIVLLILSVATSSKGLHAERPNNSGVRVKGMNPGSTHLGVGGLATSSVEPLRWGSWSVRPGRCNEG
jgi:hypothetical protein